MTIRTWKSFGARFWLESFKGILSLKWVFQWNFFEIFEVLRLDVVHWTTCSLKLRVSMKILKTFRAKFWLKIFKSSKNAKILGQRSLQFSIPKIN